MKNTLLVLALPLAIWFAGSASAQVPDAPFGGLDAHAVFYAPYDVTTKGQYTDRQEVLRSNFAIVPGGIYSTSAAKIPPGPTVGLYNLPSDFELSQGTIEMWVTPGSTPGRRAHLFSLRGAKSLDGDPWNELIVGEEEENGAPLEGHVYFSNGNGTIDLANPAVFPSRQLRGVGVGDVDGDGDLDLVANMMLAEEIQFFMGPISRGRIYTAPSFVIPSAEPQGLALVDLDGDDDLDLVVACFSDQTPPLVGFENDGAGHFSPMNWSWEGAGATYPGAEATSIGDVNHDGVLDILFGAFSGFPSALFFGHIDSNGDYIIEPNSGRDIGFADSCLGANLSDLNDDGWLDVVLARTGGDVGDPSGGQVLVYYNQFGAFPFGPLVIPSFGPFTLSAERDLDNDGHLDIAVANWKTTTSLVYLGPNFSSALTFPAVSAVSLTLGDLTGDGISDIVYRDSEGTVSPLYELDLDGKVASTTAIPTHETLLGMSVFSAVTGTTPYGTVTDRSNSLELFVENGLLVFEATDARNRSHSVAVPFPGPSEDQESGFHFVHAEWSEAEALLRVGVGNPGHPAKSIEITVAGGLSQDFAQPVFRLGTGDQNQAGADSWLLDDARLSTVRRSQNVCQEDLGYEGPGNARLSACGEALYPGQQSTLTLETGVSGTALVYLLAGLSINPTELPALGGTLVPVPLFIFTFPVNGRIDLPVDGGSTNGFPLELFLQALVSDPTVPTGFAFTNALAMVFVP